MNNFAKKLTKFVAVVLSFTLLLAGIPIGVVSAASDVKISADGKYIYKVFLNGTINLMGFDETAQILEIPETIDGYTVTQIQPEIYVSNPLEGFGYFGQENDRLTHVILPETLTWLGDSVFENCIALESVYIPDSVYYVGGWCFYGCTSLTSVTIPKSCTRLGDAAFEGCHSLSTVVFHDNINYIGPATFRDCYSLTSITLPDSVIEIADFVFANCTKLAEVNIPENVERIGCEAFAGCGLLTDFEIPESVVDVAAGAFSNTGYDIPENWEDDLLYIDNWLVAATPYISGDVTIKEGTVGIAGEVFAECGVTDVKLPSSLKYIAEYAFAGVESYVGQFNQNGWYIDNWLIKPDTAYDENFTVIDGTVGIAGGAFSSRYRLNHITLPDSVKYIGAFAFYNCEGLTKVTMGPVEHIGSGAFNYCESLTDITLPESLTYLGNMAFGSCAFTEITIPQPITKLHTFTFGSCENLQTITLHHGITNIYFDTFYNCPSLNQVRYDGTEDQWNAISIEDGNEDFLNAELVYIESSHTHNWEWVIDKNPTCIQSGLKHEACATPGCFATQNETVIQPNGEHIWEWVIDTEATCKQEGKKHEECECGATQSENEVIPMLTEHVYENGACKYCKIVNIGDFTLMFGETPTSSYVEIQGYIGKAEHINLPDRIRGSLLTKIQGATFLNCDFIKTISIPIGVTKIGDSAFQDCSGLTAVYYAGTKAQWNEIIISAGNDCLLATTVYCSDGPVNNAYDYIVKDDHTVEITGYNGNNADLEIPSQIGEYTVTSIGNEAFCRNNTIDSITLPDTITSIGEYAFYYSDLKSIDIGNGVEIIGRNAFGGCDYLETLIIGDSLSTIGYNAFYICSSFKNITVSENNKNFSAVNNVLFNKDKTELLKYCTGSYDSGYSIPTTVTHVADDSFYGAKWLKEITITDNVTTLGSYAFSDCTQLSDVHIGAGVQNIGLNAFGGFTNVERYTISQENPYYSSLNGVWFDKDQTKLIMYPFGNTATSYTVPDGVTEIGEKAFDRAQKLWSVVLSDSVTTIRSEAFSRCSNLISVTIGENITSIENAAFYNCDALTDVYYGGSEKSWNNIAIANSNAKLTNATVHYAKTSHQHDWYWVIDIPATCGATGVKHEECADTNCSATRSENSVIPATGNHTYDKQVVAEKYLKSVASCSSSAVYYNSCVCGAKGTTTFATGSKLSHKSDSGTVTKKATCTATGTKVYKCTLCKTTIKTETIAKVAHKYDSGKVTKAATCNASGVKTYTCVVCKGTKTETIAKSTSHTYSNNCDKSCNVCGKTRTVGAHKYSNACDTTCNYCSAKRTIKHIYTNNCDTTCNVCEAKRTIKHTYTNNCDTTCNVCKAKRTIKHIYTNNCDTSCNVCKATRSITHAYKTTTTKATTSKNGSIVKKCAVCGKVASTTIIKYAKTFKLSTTAYTYNGGVKTPSVTVKDADGKTLKKNTDYTVTYASGRKNTGTYTVTVKMIGKYSGTKTLTFKINPAKISSCNLSATSYTYDGKVKKPTVTVKNSSGTKLTTSSYTVTYASGRKNVGTYKVTIKGKGNYTGTKTLTFKINPAKTTVSKLTAGVKSIKVGITKKSAQVTGYQIQYSASKTFSPATTKTISGYNTTSYTLKGLSAKRTYFIRVRTYKTVNNTKYYSGWSAYKYVKTK